MLRNCCPIIALGALSRRKKLAKEQGTSLINIIFWSILTLKWSVQSDCTIQVFLPWFSIHARYVQCYIPN